MYVSLTRESKRVTDIEKFCVDFFFIDTSSSDIQFHDLYKADTKQYFTCKHLFRAFDTIEKADYPSGVRLVALKRAVVDVFWSETTA